MSDAIEMKGVTEYAEGLPVSLKLRDGRLVIDALNECGYNGVEIDLLQLLWWLRAYRPDLIPEVGILHLGVCVTQEKLSATVMRYGPNGHVTVIAVAEMDLAPLVNHDHIITMIPAVPPARLKQANDDTYLVQSITCAYEQGFGQAFRDDVTNPYSEGSVTAQAWDEGRRVARQKGRCPTCGGGDVRPPDQTA